MKKLGFFVTLFSGAVYAIMSIAFIVLGLYGVGVFGRTYPYNVAYAASFLALAGVAGLVAITPAMARVIRRGPDPSI